MLSIARLKWPEKQSPPEWPEHRLGWRLFIWSNKSSFRKKSLENTAAGKTQPRRIGLRKVFGITMTGKHEKKSIFHFRALTATMGVPMVPTVLPRSVAASRKYFQKVFKMSHESSCRTNSENVVRKKR